MSYPTPARAYAPSVGIVSIPEKFYTNRDPNSHDINGPSGQWPVGQFWINTTNFDTLQLQGFSSLGGTVTAVWQRIAAGQGGNIQTITPNTGGAVASDINSNLNFVGDGTGLTLTGNPATNTITGTISGGGFGVVDVTAATQTMAANIMYVVNNAGSMITFTLPVVAAEGDTYIIHGKTSLGWQVNVTTGQTIHLGSRATTTSTGHIGSNNQWDTVTITCVTANTTFACRAVQGDITIV